MCWGRVNVQRWDGPPAGAGNCGVPALSLLLAKWGGWPEGERWEQVVGGGLRGRICGEVGGGRQLWWVGAGGNFSRETSELFSPPPLKQTEEVLGGEDGEGAADISLPLPATPALERVCMCEEPLVLQEVALGSPGQMWVGVGLGLGRGGTGGTELDAGELVRSWKLRLIRQPATSSSGCQDQLPQ